MAEFFELILSGFAGSTDGISAALAALSHAVFEFKDKLSKPMLDMLMENMNVLLASNVRDIVSSVFGFLKVLFSRLVGFELGPHVPRLVASISGMEDNFRRFFRVKIRELFAVLIRKFRYAMIVDLVPGDNQKLINNIRKTQDREKRQKKEKRTGKRSGGDAEEEWQEKKSRVESVGGRSRAETVNDILDELASSDEETEGKKPKVKRPSVYITEENEEEIVDFTHPNASQKISGKFNGQIFLFWEDFFNRFLFSSLFPSFFSFKFCQGLYFIYWKSEQWNFEGLLNLMQSSHQSCFLWKRIVVWVSVWFLDFLNFFFWFFFFWFFFSVF